MNDLLTENNEDLLINIGRLYCDLDTVNDILRIDHIPNTHYLTFAIDITDMPYTMVFTSPTDKAKSIARELNDMEEIDTADTLLLFFDRSVMGSFDSGIKGFITKTGKKLGGFTKSKEISENFQPLYCFSEIINSYLNDNNNYDTYKNLDINTSGIMLKVKDNTIKSKVVSGKNRPDMECRDPFNMQYVFSQEKPIVMGRPYIDEITKSTQLENMSWDEIIEKAEDGDEECIEKLFEAYINGSKEDEEPKQDFNKAVYWLKKLAQLNNSNGQYNLALCYAKGCGVERDFQKALEWIKKAADNGDEDALPFCNMLENMIKFEKQAKKGDAKAQAKLAKMYAGFAGFLTQFGPEQDYKEALYWAKESFKQGEPEGAWILARAYHNGLGVDVDIDKAISYCESGASYGSPECMYLLGIEYLNGDNVSCDEEKGFEFIERAAYEGYGPAMRDLGKCYQFGNGCDEDMQQALYWYKKALKVIDDPELEKKVMIFSMLENNKEDIDDNDCDEDNDYDDDYDEDEDYDADDDDDYDDELDCDENKSKSTTFALTETQKRNLILKDKVYSFVQENPKTTAKAIAEHFNLSSQELTPIMSKLLVDGVIIFETVKKIKYFYVVDDKYENDDDDDESDCAENKQKCTENTLTETQKRNLILKDKVYSFVQENPKTTAKAIAEHFNLSSQELTPIMSKLLVDGVIIFETVKKIKYYSVVDERHTRNEEAEKDNESDCAENKIMSTELTETQKRNLILKDQVYKFIKSHPRTTIEDIAEHCNISPQELTPIMSKLLVDGVITFETVKKIFKKIKYYSVVE